MKIKNAIIKVNLILSFNLQIQQEDEWISESFIFGSLSNQWIYYVPGCLSIGYSKLLKFYKIICYDRYGDLNMLEKKVIEYPSGKR